MPYAFTQRNWNGHCACADAHMKASHVTSCAHIYNLISRVILLRHSICGHYEDDSFLCTDCGRSCIRFSGGMGGMEKGTTYYSNTVNTRMVYGWFVSFLSPLCRSTTRSTQLKWKSWLATSFGNPTRSTLTNTTHTRKSSASRLGSTNSVTWWVPLWVVD